MRMTWCWWPARLLRRRPRRRWPCAPPTAGAPGRTRRAAADRPAAGWPRPCRSARRRRTRWLTGSWRAGRRARSRHYCLGSCSRWYWILWWSAWLKSSPGCLGVQWAAPAVAVAAHERAGEFHPRRLTQQHLERAPRAELAPRVPRQGQRAHAVVVHPLGRGVVNPSSGIAVLEGLELDLQRSFGKAEGVRLDGDGQALHQLLLGALVEHVALEIAVLGVQRLVDRSARSGGVHRGRRVFDEVRNPAQRHLPVFRM